MVEFNQFLCNLYRVLSIFCCFSYFCFDKDVIFLLLIFQLDDYWAPSISASSSHTEDGCFKYHKLKSNRFFSNAMKESINTQRQKKIIQILSIKLQFQNQICISLLFIAEGHKLHRNWLNSTISIMHILIEFNHSNDSGFLSSIIYWIQPIQPISSLM